MWCWGRQSIVHFIKSHAISCSNYFGRDVHLQVNKGTFKIPMTPNDEDRNTNENDLNLTLALPIHHVVFNLVRLHKAFTTNLLTITFANKQFWWNDKVYKCVSLKIKQEQNYNWLHLTFLMFLLLITLEDNWNVVCFGE